MSRLSVNDGGNIPAVVDRRTLSDRTRISPIPKLPPRAPNSIAAKRSICVNCEMDLKNESYLAQRILVCAKCLTIYAKVDDAITKANENRSYSIFEG